MKKYDWIICGTVIGLAALAFYRHCLTAGAVVAVIGWTVAAVPVGLFCCLIHGGRRI